MNSAAPIGNRADLIALFDALGSELSDQGVTAEIVMVGGSWLLWHAQRAATHDVDSAKRLHDEVRAAARRVARRSDLAPDWLNDQAAGFWPADASYADCTVVHVAGGLVVRAPPARLVFVMKLYRGTPQDHEDMVTLWSRCDFTDPADALAAYWRAYPHAPEDPYLLGYIEDIAAEATSS